MKTILKTAIAGLILTATMSGANAALVGSISKTYGSTGTSTASTGAGGCDTLNATSITVRDTRSCQRFYDSFDFSAFSYGTLDHLTLTLQFGSTNDVNNITVPFLGTFAIPEDWRVRFADSATHGSATLQNMNEVGGPVFQSFDLTAAQADVFPGIALNQMLYLWFAEEAAGANNFELYSARLDVYDTSAVPEPGSLALIGAALGALGLSRRRKR